MERQNSKRNRKIRNLVVISTLCAVVLTVSTYAWFIGMKTVSVNSFDIDIATTEGLFLSMDGKSWTYNLDVAGAPVYAKNTNTWAEDGLIPISSVGDLDSTVSRMKLYEKGSLTTTKGGYRLLTSRVNNYTSAGDTVSQGKGYVAFDLFIKNLSGTEYYTENNVLNEEAVYLTTDSAVKVGSTGGVTGTGIENSVRVAFAQIGRVKGDTVEEDAKNLVTGITCASTTDTGAEGGNPIVTGICRDAQIWEPNDTKHVQNAINWYNTSCKERVTPEGAEAPVTDVTLASSYKTTSCTTVTDGTYSETYAINNVVGISDNVDVYDGADYNKYIKNVISFEDYRAKAIGTRPSTTQKLVAFDYFTDTEKNQKRTLASTDTDRPTFMTLAPNSITKVRVYIYIEGQDVDNYDFASLGNQISVAFGFTKEKYKAGDVGYDDVTPLVTPTE